MKFVYIMIVPGPLAGIKFTQQTIRVSNKVVLQNKDKQVHKGLYKQKS